MAESHYLVVGGSRGIGWGLTQRLLAAGHRVHVVSRTTGDLDTAQLGWEHIAHDVTQPAFPTDAIPERLAGLAYCPGSISLGPLRGIQPDALVDEFRLNVVGAVLAIQAALPALKRSPRSSIVTFSTVAVGQGMPMHATVSTVKGAIEGLTRTLAAELAPKIRVNSIAPALVDTSLAERLLSNDQKREAMGKRHPLGRVGTIDDIAAAAEFLITDNSDWITGQVMGVDGGLSSLRA